MDKPRVDIPALIDSAISDSEIPKIYANGFATAVGNGDSLIMLQLNRMPVAVLNLSFTVAKTLALKLGNLIKEVEDKANTVILTTDDFSEKFATKDDGEDKNAGS